MAIPSEGKVLVDFYADWCGPCKAMSPTLEAFEQVSEVPLVKVNVDQERDLAMRYDVRGIPCFIYFEDGIAKSRASGVQSLQQLKNLTM
jgi:thioredoxin 1|tara:strand:- start:1368 stop:1634 length:267 start_codon:yes stop_codon:yes gene_type:complete